jgi:hypothetical protein
MTGRTLATKIVGILTANGVSARRARLPVIKKDQLSAGSPDVTVSPASMAGDEQDRGSELLLYSVTVGVTANVGDPESSYADAAEDLVEEIQELLASEDNQTIDLTGSGSDLDRYAILELPYENDPIYNVQLLREAGLYQSLTVFTYQIERSRR